MWFKQIQLWFTKLGHMMRFHNIGKETSQLTEHQPSRKLCEALFTELSPAQFKEYEPYVGGSHAMSPLYPGIELYTAKMKELTRLVKQDRTIPPDWNDAVMLDTVVDRFFVSTDGYYLDIIKAVTDYKEAGLQLCIAMTPSDTETYGVHEHNLRMLTKLFVNMRHTTTALINVSLTKNA